MTRETALDALETIRLMPTASSLWRRLSALTDAIGGDAQIELVDRIAALPLETRDAQWLRCSALAYLTRDSRWFARQAALADETSVPDAIMTLLALSWHHALVRTPDRAAFVQLLSDIDAPRLQRLIAARLPPRDDPRGMPGTPLRVAVYTPQVSNSRHGGTAFTLNVMSVLARAGFEPRAFAAQETSIPASASYCGGAESVEPLPVELESLKLNAPGSVQFILPSTEFSVRFRFDQMARAIDAYAPDLVIFVGLMSPLVYRLHAHYPVVGLSVHALPPAAPVDVWLSGEQQSAPSCWPSVPAPQAFPFPFRFWPTGPATPIDRCATGFAGAGIVMVTVGYRLAAEIVPPWSERMLAFVEAHADVHWLMIGVGEGEPTATMPLHPRIRTVPPQGNLPAWLAACDIYVNPPRLGGGGTVAMAMEQGLPVATIAGSDGADKVGEWAVSHGDDYFALLASWVSDPAARKQAGNALKELFHSRLDLSCEQATAGMTRACHRAIELFNQRMGTTPA